MSGLLPDSAGTTLLQLARGAIAHRLQRSASPVDAQANWLDEQRATFVTLKLDGALRGCIGSLEATRPLREDVRDNARAAAFRDPRFPPLTSDEFERVQIEVSVLTAPQPMNFADRSDALAQLRPGIDGVILASRGRRATFLPQVWEQLPDTEQFVRALQRKAGLAEGSWDRDTHLARYQVQAFEEPTGRFGTTPGGHR